MRKKWWNGSLALGLLALAGSPLAAPPDGVMLAQSCGGCHGTNGVSAGTIMPSLAGQSRDYFIASMQRFRSGERPSTVMGRLAAAYSNGEIAAMAAYFARRKPAPQTGPLDAKLVQKGLTIYYKQCKYCHLDGRLWQHFHQYREYERDCNKSCHLNYGPDTKDDTPLIGGQWPAYLRVQMEDFRSGKRKMSEKKAQAIKPLSREDLEAVVQFYASQKDLTR